MNQRHIKSLVFVLSLISIISFFLVQILQTNTDFFSTKYSDYIFGSFGSIVTITLITFASSVLLIAYSLRKKRKTVALLFLLAGIGCLISGLFPTTIIKDLNPQRVIHTIGAGVSFLFLPISILLFAKYLAPKKTKSISKFIAIKTLLLFAIMSILLVTGLDKKIGYFGFLEKIDILALQLFILIWSLT